MLWVFFLFLPLFTPLSYTALLIHIVKRIRKFNFKKIFVSDFLFFNLVLLSLFITVLVSTLSSPYRMNSLLVFPLLCFYLLVHFVMREATKRQGEKWLLDSIFLSLFFLCGFGIIQYLLNLNINVHIWIFHLHSPARNGIGSLLGAKNGLAAYLVLTIPLVLTSISGKGKSKRKNAFLLILLFLGLFCLVLTDSLGGIGAIGIMIVIYLLVKNWKVGLIVLGIGGLVLLLFQGYLPMIIEKYSAAEIRMYTWKNVCIPLIKDHPLLGIGIGAYPKIAPYYAPDAIKSSAHNIYLHYIVEMGSLGASFLFLSIIIPLLYLIKLSRHKNSPYQNLSFGLALSIASILIFCIIETVMDGFQLGLLIWSLTGIGLGIYSRDRVANLSGGKNGKRAT